MKRGLYLAFGFNFDEKMISKDTYNGLAKKVYYQIETFNNAGFEVKFYNPYLERNPQLYKIERRLPFSYLHSWKFDFSNINQYSFIYIRKSWFMDGDIIRFLKKVKEYNSKVKIILEIPTYPYDAELKGLKALPLLKKDQKWRQYLHSYVDRIITYSDDDEIFGVKTIKAVNAISFNDIKRNNILKEIDNNRIEIMACSRLAYWHGYDRAITGLSNYYKSDNVRYNIILHIVGDGEELDNYKSLVNKLDLNDHIIFHGYLYGSELDEIYNNCVVGLDSMGRHRSGVFYNSSLKGKEYAAKGLIIISGVKTELDLKSDYQYYYRIPADDTPLDFCGVLDYFDMLLENESITEIQKNIMNFAKDNFDYSVAMSDIISYINN